MRRAIYSYAARVKHVLEDSQHSCLIHQ